MSIKSFNIKGTVHLTSNDSSLENSGMSDLHWYPLKISQLNNE